jgi:ABC-type branched-subunit amino acid transport system ATPase component
LNSGGPHPGIPTSYGLRLLDEVMAGPGAAEIEAVVALIGSLRTDIDRVLTLFPSLADRLGQVAGTLSGGEQQMCAIARGLMSRPKLIMIDELSLGLAPLIVDEIVTRLPDIAASGTAVLLVEQDFNIAPSVSITAHQP